MAQREKFSITSSVSSNFFEGKKMFQKTRSTKKTNWPHFWTPHWGQCQSVFVLSGFNAIVADASNGNLDSTGNISLAMELFNSKRRRLYRPEQKAVVFKSNPQKIMQHMHGTIPYMFDCWADPVVHLLLVKNSMA